MVNVTKEFTFDCAHLLEGHAGLCQNVHGHTYKMQVIVASMDGELIDAGASEGMVVDFSHLKADVNDAIVGKIDHAFVCRTLTTLPLESKERAIGSTIKNLGMRVFEMPIRPTAENMVEYFMKVLNKELCAKDRDYYVVGIRLWETPTSFAEVFNHA